MRDWGGTLESMNDGLYVEERENADREERLTTAIIDSQIEKGADKGGLRSSASGYDGGKMALGHTATGSRIERPVAGRSRRSRQRAGPRRRRGSAPRVTRRSFAFSRAHHLRRRLSRAGDASTLWSAAGRWELQIVRRCHRHRFAVLPKRRLEERTFASISRGRRLARDYERHAREAAAFVRLAMLHLKLRRLA